jgi:two-component system, cell cycle sensor histidine kinase and response regulator CckA
MNAASREGVVLMVDDEPAICNLMKEFLEFEGFDVITAGNGLDGLRRYQENHDRVQVVITDLDMPAMNGAEMLREIFQMRPAMKVIVASGRRPSQNDLQVESSSTSCLQKPYSPRELAEAVRVKMGS